MYELQRRWQDSSFQSPLAFTIIASPLKIFWKQAIHVILLGIAIGLLGMTLLLFIPNSEPNAKKKIIEVRKNQNRTFQNHSILNFEALLELNDILFFSKMSYWRGNWAADNLFAYMSTCKSDVSFFIFKH